MADAPAPERSFVGSRIRSPPDCAGPFARLRRALATFMAAFAVIFILIVAAGVYHVGASGISLMSPLQSIAILCALSPSAGLLVNSLVHQMAPRSQHSGSLRQYCRLPS